MLSLMIVDDSNIIRRRIERSGVQNKFQLVAAAANGHDAIEMYKKHRPQVVTMDITMPGMDGIEAIDNIIRLNPEVRILVISALSDKATGILALQKGARGFLCKPFSDDALVSALIELTED